jgi:hypothetical protein
MILQLNITIPLNRQELLQEHKKLFFDLLAHCRSVCNRAGNRPADLANDSFIQALFSENLSFLQVEKKLENRKAVESAVKKFLTNYTLSEKQHNGLSESETKDNEQVVSLKK